MNVRYTYKMMKTITSLFVFFVVFTASVSAFAVIEDFAAAWGTISNVKQGEETLLTLKRKKR